MYRGFGSSPSSAPFRAAYGKIGNVRGFSRAPLLCLTATATKKTRQHIVKTLLMKNVLTVTAPPEKRNIHMAASSVPNDEEIEATFAWLIEELKTKGKDTPKTLIYCRSINSCGEIYGMFDDMLSDTKNIAMYHSKTPDGVKHKILENFSPEDGHVRVVIATTALGMGVNIPNIECVCHYGIPDSIEDYVQEIGRAGRDGRSVHGIIYYKSYHLAHCEEAMRMFVKNTDKKCRREIISKHFKSKSTKCNVLQECCDICSEECACDQPSCQETPYAIKSVVQDKSTSRMVDDEDRELLREVLQDLKCSLSHHSSIFGSDTFAEVDDDLINDLVDNCHLVFNIEYLMEKFPIFNVDSARHILEVFMDVFGDVEEVEFTLGLDIGKFEEDDPLCLNHSYDDGDEGEISSEGEISYYFED